MDIPPSPNNIMVITVLPVAPKVTAIVHLLLRPPRKFIGLKRNDADMLSLWKTAA